MIVESLEKLPQIVVFEPVTFLTDLMLGALCLHFYIQSNARNYSIWWKWLFLLMSSSTTIGAFVHGFYPTHEGLAGQSLWLISQSLTVLAAFCLQIASLPLLKQFVFPERQFIRIYLVILIGILILIVMFRNYHVVLFGLILSCSPVLIINLILALKGYRASKFYFIGLALFLSTAFIYILKLRLSFWVNHNDIAHLVMLFGFRYLFNGVRESQVLSRQSYPSRLA